MMRFLLISVLAGLFAASNATAQEYRFTVPVRVENMRHAENVRVDCGISYWRGSSLASYSQAVMIPLTDGSFNDTVQITVPFPRAPAGEPEILPSAVRGWGCYLGYVWRVADGTLYNNPFGSGAARNAAYTRDTGQAIVSSNMSWEALAPTP